MKKTILIVFVLLTSCSAINNLMSTATPTITDTPQPTATHTPTNTPEPSNTPLPSKTLEPNCVIDDAFLTRLKQAVPHEHFVLHHNILGGIHTLVVWYIDPEIDMEVSEEGLQDEHDRVIERASQLAVSLYQVDPCVGATFDGFNPVVVDANYNGWFSGLLDSDEIIGFRGNVSTLQELYVRPYMIPNLPEAIGELPAGSCNWEETEEKIWFHFSRDRENVGFYYVHDLEGWNVWAQWDSPPLMPLNFPNILNITMELDCLYPEPENLILMSVDETGTVHFLGVIFSNNGEFSIENLQVLIGE